MNLRKVLLLTGASFTTVLILFTAVVQANPLKLLAPSPVLLFQGQLLDPDTNAPLRDGEYEVTFNIYNVDAGGSALWSETKNVVAVKGLFNTMLGDTEALDSSIFNGQPLWLGIQVERDAEASPRQPIGHVPYAIHANNADTLDGQSAANFAGAGHTHDTRYYTETESANLFVNASGDSMSGPLTVPLVKYTTPRTHYFVIGGEGFVPGTNVAYVNTYGNGGAYVNTTGFHALVAPVHLPQGAVITEFKVYFNDTSSANMTVTLSKQFLTGGGYSTLAQVTSSGTSGYQNKVDTTISGATVDNRTTSYHVYAYSDTWSSTLRIKGALITYTINEAP